MAPGVTLGAKMVVTEQVFGVAMFGLLLAMLGFLLLLGVFTRPYWGTARQQQRAHIAGEDTDDWIRVDAAPPPHSRGEDENDAPQPPSAEENDHNAPPTREPAQEEAEKEAEEEAPENATPSPIPAWVQKGAPPPQSFQDLLDCTPDSMLRCRKGGKCSHNRLTKAGTSYFSAHIKCRDCGELLAVYDKPK